MQLLYCSMKKIRLAGFTSNRKSIETKYILKTIIVSVMNDVVVKNYLKYNFISAENSYFF